MRTHSNLLYCFCFNAGHICVGAWRIIIIISRPYLSYFFEPEHVSLSIIRILYFFSCALLLLHLLFTFILAVSLTQNGNKQTDGVNSKIRCRWTEEKKKKKQEKMKNEKRITTTTKNCSCRVNHFYFQNKEKQFPSTRCSGAPVCVCVCCKRWREWEVFNQTKTVNGNGVPHTAQLTRSTHSYTVTTITIK